MVVATVWKCIMKTCKNCDRDISLRMKRTLFCTNICSSLYRADSKRAQRLLDFKYLKEFTDKCEYCDKVMGKKSIDHIIPYSRIKDKNIKQNIAIICFSCNASKGKKDLIEWAEIKEIKLRRYMICRYNHIKKLSGL